MKKDPPAVPGRVLAAAMHAGLAALVRLASRRVTRDHNVQSLFDGVQQMWKDAGKEWKKGKLAGINDFSPIFNAEPNIRKNYLGMLWLTTEPYGNTETRRVYSWHEGTMGPLNELLNYAGAQLRGLAMKHFPFPKPQYYQVREYADGKRIILHRSTALRHPPQDALKAFWIACYPGNSRHPRVKVRHSTLPELDFVDMIRAHLIELVRQCFIYNVPRKTSHRYIRLLIHRLCPFLDWVYTDGAHGRKDFWPEADRELRRIVLEIRAVHGSIVGRTSRLTHQLVHDTPIAVTKKVFEQQAKKASRSDPSKDMRKACKVLRQQVKKGHLCDRDAEQFMNDILAVCQREGNEWHRVLTSDMYQPPSLRAAVFAGDVGVTPFSDILVAAEVPVSAPKAMGQADIVTFVRREIGDRIVRTPFMLLDIKTKTGIDWSLFAMRTRPEVKKAKVPVFDYRKRTLTDSEWKRIMQGTPSKKESAQLEAYEKGLLDEYREIFPQDTSAPESLWKGIVIVDTDQPKDEISDLLHWLIQAVSDDLRSGNPQSGSRTLYVPSLSDRNEDNQPRLALILTSTKGPLQILEETVPLEVMIDEDPFKERVKDKIEFTLYLTVTSQTSSGESAGWAARNWHLLHHLRELQRVHDRRTKIVWLDLMGDFPTRELAGIRLRVAGKTRPQNVSKRLMKHLKAVVDSIEFHDLSEEIGYFLFESSSPVEKRLRSRVRKALKTHAKTNRIVIVDGWADLREITPPRLQSLLRALESRLLTWLPAKNIEIIWLDKPMVLPTRSGTYQRPEVKPLPHDSPRRMLLDEVIWNLPTSPRVFGWKTPRREDVRVVVHDTPTSADPHITLVTVPHLKGWAKRFRADSRKDRKVSKAKAETPTQPRAYYRGSMSSIYTDMAPLQEATVREVKQDAVRLAPSLQRSRASTSEERTMEDMDEEGWFHKVELHCDELSPVVHGVGILDRVRFVPLDKAPRRNRWGKDKSRKYYPARQITRGWIWKQKRDREDRRIRHTGRPPLVKATPIKSLDTKEVRRQEVVRVLLAARFLRRQFPVYDGEWIQLLDEVMAVCRTCFRTRGGKADPLDVLREIAGLLARHRVSAGTWQLLCDTREQLGHDLLRLMREVLKEAMDKNPDLITIYGNGLFLLVLAVRKKQRVLAEWQPYLVTLWEAIASWQLVHMGFVPNEQSELGLRSKYDLARLWSNLLWRAGRLVSGPPPPSLFESYRLGQFVVNDDGDLMLVFQRSPGSSQMIAGLIEESGSQDLRWGWHRAVVNLKKIASAANYSIKSSERPDFVISRVGETDILWSAIADSETDNEWSPLGRLEYGHPPKGSAVPVRWFRLSKPPQSLDELLMQPSHVEIPEEIDERVTETLYEIGQYMETARHVKCEVSVDVETRRYLVWFLNANDIELVEGTLELENTADVIATLRRSSIEGDIFEDGNNVIFTWTPVTDVFYDEIEIEGDALSLTFLKPFVHRKSFFPDHLVLPRTAEDLLKTTLEENLLIVATPSMELYMARDYRCWRVWFVGPQLGHRLRELENRLLTVFDMALLCECEQVVDIESGFRYPAKVVLNGIDEVTFPDGVFEYSRFEAVLEERGVLQDGEAWGD